MKSFIWTILFILGYHLAMAQQTKVLHFLRGHEAPVTLAKFSRDGRWLVSADQHKVIKVWDISTGECLKTIRNIKKPILDINISATGGLIAASTSDKTIKVWYSHTGKLIFSRKIGDVTDLRFNPKNEYQLLTNKNRKKLKLSGLVTGQSNTNVIQLWDIYRKQRMSRINLDQDVHQIDYDPEGSFIVTTGNQSTVTIWHVLHAQKNSMLSYDREVQQVKFSPDGSKLAIAFTQGKVFILNNRNRALKDTISIDGQITSIYFSHDNNYLVVIDQDQNIQSFLLKSKKTFVQQVTYAHIKDVWAYDEEILVAQIGQDNNEIQIKNYHPNFEPDTKRRVREYVENALEKWQLKDKFEKSADYAKRVTEANRQKQLKVFTQQAINSLAQQDLDWQKTHNEYDADNETFRIDVDNTYAFYLKVPLKNAKKFDQNFSKIRYKNPQFTLDAQGKFQLLHVELHYSSSDGSSSDRGSSDRGSSDKPYIYDNNQQVAFNSRQLTIKLDPIQVKIPIHQVQKRPTSVQTSPKALPTTTEVAPRVAAVDQNLPQTQMKNPDAIAVVIGNRNYLKTKEVQFAINDARSIKKYLIEVLGFQPGNIYYQENATKGDFEVLFGNQSNHQGKLYNTIKAGKSDVFVFYSGHGAPDTKNFKGYFVPVECDPQYVSLAGYSIDLFYRNLAKLPAKSVTVVLDACFSGADILKNISPIGIQPKGIKSIRDGVLLTSSQGTQVSSWYNAKQHGLFTYFFLKAIHNKNADANRDDRLTFKELYQYIANQTEGIPYWARRLHNVEQMPALRGKNKEKVFVQY